MLLKFIMIFMIIYVNTVCNMMKMLDHYWNGLPIMAYSGSPKARARSKGTTRAGVVPETSMCRLRGHPTHHRRLCLALCREDRLNEKLYFVSREAAKVAKKSIKVEFLPKGKVRTVKDQFEKNLQKNFALFAASREINSLTGLSEDGIGITFLSSISPSERMFFKHRSG